MHNLHRYIPAFNELSSKCFKHPPNTTLPDLKRSPYIQQAYWFNDFGADFWDLGQCPGQLTVAVASVLLLAVPGEGLFRRVERHFGTKSRKGKRENYDMDIVNAEFACGGEVLVLPKGPFTYDVRKNLGILDVLPPCHFPTHATSQ